MSTQALITRLADPSFRLVGGAAEFGALADSAPPAPCAFVLHLGDDSATKEPFTSGTQLVARMYGVILCVRNVRDAAGASASADLVAFRKLLFDRLVGWEPFGGAEPLHFARGRLLKFEAGVQWWQDDFLTSFYTSRPEAWA